jgi:tRNA A-37 threonylcarbamoyl transferase component Bud32
LEPHTWDRIQEVYGSALPLPPAERKDFVAQACGFDPYLTREICLLLSAHDSLSGFLQAPLFELGLRIIDSEISGSPELADPAEKLIGSTIDGRYVVESRLADGGIARVYLARDLRLHERRVVVKVLLDKSLRNERILQKFQHEREALARLDHPGVVNIFDAGELPDQKPYLVMQYVSGSSLREIINAKPEGIEFERAASIIRGIGAALNAVHQNGVYHRDLKPENIMLQRVSPTEEHVKVLDFGIAKVKESLIGPSTMTGAGAIGTFSYMSPEQLHGDKVAAASDVYSLAVIAYEMLTGRRPFVADTVPGLAKMQRDGLRVKPADLRQRLPGEAQAIIINGLAFDPRMRSFGAGEFGERLSRALTAGEDGAFEHAGLEEAVDSFRSSRVSGAAAETQASEITTAGKLRFRRWLILAAAVVLLSGAVLGWYWRSRKGVVFDGPANSRSASSLPHRTLNYSLTVQKMRNGKPYLGAFESSGQEVFENGYRFRLNVSSRQAGYLYVFNEGPPEKDRSNFTIIYPTPVANEGSARLEQNQDMQTNWNTFGGEPGTERFWIVWSADVVMPLEIARYEAFKNGEGAIADAVVARSLRDFLSEHSNPAPETIKETAKQRTSVRTSGDLLVKLVELEHR